MATIATTPDRKQKISRKRKSMTAKPAFKAYAEALKIYD